jgi:dinuclear metal center YbgI/SA1388 family protein
MQLAEVLRTLEQLAPLSGAESWDNVGLLLGDRQQSVERVLTCLTLTPDVAAEAVAEQVQLVVTHHPVMFKPVQRITTATLEGRTLWPLLSQGISVYSPHTAWDNAPAGINQSLAERLQLQQIQPIRPATPTPTLKLITFVPLPALAAVQAALWSAGCGRIGAYDHCSFVSPGEGTFWGTDTANPVVGQAGQLERVPEQRLEVICPSDRLTAAVTALRAAHPYEEPAFDVIPLQTVPSIPSTVTGVQGAGRLGRLPRRMELRELAKLVEETLSVRVSITAEGDLPVDVMGVACGAAADFWVDAAERGCQALLTGEARFHTAVACRERRFGLIVADHYATERPAMELLADQLRKQQPSLWVNPSRVERNPLQSLGPAVG